MSMPRALSFSGGGHLLIYHLGVLNALRRKGGQSHFSMFAGSSGGAIVAAVTRKTVAKMRNTMIHLTIDVVSIPGGCVYGTCQP